MKSCKLKAKAAANASRGTSARQVGPLRIRVELPVARGALRVGDVAAGQIVECVADDAIRLVTVKGFRYATPADALLAEQHIATRNAAAPAHAPAAAPAEGEGGGASLTHEQE